MMGTGADSICELGEIAVAASEALEWWLAPATFVARVTNDGPVRELQALYRLGDCLLDLVLSTGSTQEFFRGSYGDCAVAQGGDCPARIACRVTEYPRFGCAVLKFTDRPAFNLADHVLDLLRHQYLGSTEKFAEVPSSAKSWRMIATASESGRPVIGVADGQVIVDLHRQPLNFVGYFLVSAAMRIQRDTIFVHAASAAVGGAGVLLAGPSGAGKTTLSVGLAARGHDFYGENMAALRTATCEILPFRRTAFLRPGARSSEIGKRLAAEGVDLPESRSPLGVPPKTPFRTTHYFPAKSSGPAPLRHAFFLRQFAERAMLEPFVPTMSHFDSVLRPLSFDILVAASWGAESGWLMKHFQLCAMLSKVRCFHLDLGDPDETLDLIERTVLEES